MAHGDFVLLLDNPGRLQTVGKRKKMLGEGRDNMMD